MSKVYVVCRGEYSGRYVDSVFSTEQEAKDYCCIITDGEIEERELDKPGLAPKAYHKYYCYIDKGVVKGAVLCDDDEYNIPNTIHLSQSLDNCNDSSFSYWMVIMAKNADYAHKQIADRFAQIKATMETHFPLLHTSCVLESRSSFRTSYPIYDFSTFEILLRNGQCMEEGFDVKTRRIK